MCIRDRGNGKDWNGKYEPLMEVVQTRGFAFGVMESLLSSGIKIGVVGGCDHSRPPGGVMPWKYPNALTGLWAKAVSREEIFAAMQQRRSYATSGKKIGLIFQMDDHLMGEEYDTDGSPNLHIEAKGTTEIEKIEVIRDGEVILLQTDCGQHALANYKDETAKPGEHYYYVVITQREEAGDNYKGIAVTSPIWVNKLA